MEVEAPVSSGYGESFMMFVRLRGGDESGMRRMLLVGALLLLFGGLVIWLAAGKSGSQGASGAGPAQAPISAKPPIPGQAATSGTPPESDVVTEVPKDDEFKPVQEVLVDKTTLHIGDPFDYISHLFKSYNRLGQPVIVADPDLPGSLIVTHVYVNYDRSILKVQAKRKSRRGSFLICGLWTAPPRK